MEKNRDLTMKYPKKVMENQKLRTNKCLRIGTWNVRTLYTIGKLDNLIQEAKNMRLDIVGVAETRWTDTGYTHKDEHIFIHSGGEHHERGVGFLIKKELEKHIKGYWTINDRMIILKIEAKPFDIVLLQTYAPTQEYEDEKIEEYYEDLRQALKTVKSTDVLIVMGDMNAKVGKGKYEPIVGQYGIGKRNERGDRLIQFCEENDLVICNTFYEQHIRKLYTWKSPGDRTRNQIDFIMIRNRFKNSVKKAKTYPGADINSDHMPVVIKMITKLKTQKKQQRSPRIEITALKQPETKQKYICDVKNKYENLMLESIEQYRRENPTELINSKWECIKQSIKTATENIPKLEKKTKQKWMTEEILNKMAVRKATKNITEYKEIDKEIRNMCRQAKIDWLESRCKNIEDMNRNNKTIEMHKEIKTVSKRKRLHRGGCIKNKLSEIIFDEE